MTLSWSMCLSSSGICGMKRKDNNLDCRQVELTELSLLYVEPILLLALCWYFREKLRIGCGFNYKA